MSDITDAGPRLKAMNDALEEIDRLRKREAELLAAGDCLESQLCEAARERDRLRLTHAEREAVVRAWHGLLKLVAFEKQLADVHLADARTINALLARTKNG